MKRYGIYLAYAPEQDIRNQGLGRLLAFLIIGAINNKTPLVIAYPKWYDLQVRQLCKDHHIDFDQIETITTNGTPLLIRLKNIMEKFDKRTKQKSNLLKSVFNSSIKFIGKLVIRWLGMSNILYFILIGLFFLACFFIALPFLSILCIILGIELLIKKVFKKVFKNRYLKILLSPLSNLRHSLFAHQVFDMIRSQELQRLNDKINKRKDVSAWLIPTLFWPEISSIKAKKIVVVPDVVFYDFPTQFNMPVFKRTNEKLIRTINVADYFITYCNYVKEAHLQKTFGIADEKISVVSHGALDLSDYLRGIDSLSILQTYQKEKLQNDQYLADYSLKNMQYIFYSSQIRPHKNFLNLLKAYKILLRERFVNIKLIITGNLQLDPEIAAYIYQHRLQNDILSFYNVPSKVLAALNARAICAVNPTLFEGGFPFTFMEAYSVGTPSIMGNIPMTSEYIHDEALKNIMLFDPFSVNDMVEKIEWGVRNHEKLFEMQHGLAEQMKQRTWSHVASDYIKVLEDVSNR